MLDLVEIHTYYGKSHILQGISMIVKEGSVIALLGRNGMGKTTTIRTIIGFTPPKSGLIRFRGKDISHLRPYRIAQMGISLVPQGRRIFPSLSVEENLTMATRNVEKPEAWSLDKVYSLFPILKERAKYKGNFLSGGEQQMLSIGRALMTNPYLIMLDEPSEGLAPKIVLEIGQIISHLKEIGFSILLVEQNLTMALDISNYIYVLSKGHIVHESTSQEFRDNEEVKSKYLGAAA